MDELYGAEEVNTDKEMLFMQWTEMKWDFIEKLEDEKLIEEFEQFVGYTLPEDYKACVKLYNGGAPEWDSFDVKNEDIGTTDLGYLHSFNKDSGNSIWKLYDWDEECEEYKDFIGRYIEFTSTSFGDHICFDTTNNHIVFIDHETLETEELADTFSEFINSLYEYED